MGVMQQHVNDEQAGTNVCDVKKKANSLTNLLHTVAIVVEITTPPLEDITFISHTESPDFE